VFHKIKEMVSVKHDRIFILGWTITLIKREIKSVSNRCAQLTHDSFVLRLFLEKSGQHQIYKLLRFYSIFCSLLMEFRFGLSVTPKEIEVTHKHTHTHQYCLQDMQQVLSIMQMELLQQV